MSKPRECACCGALVDFYTVSNCSLCGISKEDEGFAIKGTFFEARRNLSEAAEELKEAVASSFPFKQILSFIERRILK